MEDLGNSLGERLVELGRKNLLILGLFFVGLIFLGYGLIALIGSSNSSQDVLFEAKEARPENLKVTNITVDIEGSVVKPGVYHLPLDSRIQEAISAAGDLSEFADRDWLAKNLNLAVKLTDGAKIYIPRIGEDKSITGVKGASVAGSEGGFSQVNINTANKEILDSLPGIGPVTAQKIITGRPYNSIDDLLNRKIVGSKIFSQIKEKIMVY